MASNSLFPRKGQITQGNILDVRDSVARPSLDTLYEVNFSFGNYQTWLGQTPSKSRTQGSDFMKKMSIMCTQAELPGTSFVPSTAIGHHQGIQEEFPNLRNFPPLNLVFYCDADQVILQVLESWMSYINPIFNGNQRDRSAFTRFNYPEDYKEIIHITKFEKDTFEKKSRFATYTSVMTQYEFVNCWPTNVTSMRVAYGDSNVLRCNVQFAYDRFFTEFTRQGDHRQFAVESPLPEEKSKDIRPQYQINRDNLNKSRELRRVQKEIRKNESFSEYRARTGGQ